MAAKIEPFLLFVDPDWQPGLPIRAPELRAGEVAPGLGSHAILARTLHDGATIAFASAHITAISETADERGAMIRLRSLRLMREPRVVGRNWSPLDAMIEDQESDEPLAGELGELSQEDFIGVEDDLLLDVLNANGWRCQLTGQKIPMGARIEDHVTLILPEAFDGTMRPDNLLTLSADVAQAWRIGTISADTDLSIVINLGRAGSLKAHLGSHLTVPSERFRPNPIFLRLHRYRIFDRVPVLR